MNEVAFWVGPLMSQECKEFAPSWLCDVFASLKAKVR